MPDKKERGTIIKLVAEAILSNFSAHRPATIPTKPSINDEMRIKVSSQFNNFFDLRLITDKDIVMLSRTVNIDIAIDIQKNIYDIDKKYNTGLCIQIPNVPGKLGEVSSLIGLNECNIINMEIIKKKKSFPTVHQQSFYVFLITAVRGRFFDKISEIPFYKRKVLSMF